MRNVRRIVLAVALILVVASVRAAVGYELPAARGWASAALLREPPPDGKPVVISGAAFSTSVPFSFVYDGKPSTQLLPSWKRSTEKQSGAAGEERHVVTYLDPATGLRIACEAVVYAEYPAVEWLLRLTNTGAADTPIIEKILPLDLAVTALPKGDILLHHVIDSSSGPDDYAPQDTLVAPKARITLAPHLRTPLAPGEKRPESSIPYFSVEWPGGGVVGAIGRTGQWRFKLHRNEGRELNLQAGQAVTRLKLHPGETIRTPRVLLIPWQGHDRMRGHNSLRHLLLAHYVPRVNGQTAVAPISHCTWFNFNAGNAVTEDNQVDIIRKMPPIGVEAFWLDAGWFVGGWPKGAGNWTPKPEAFPKGLRPLADAAKEKGMTFILWMEPERVVAGTKIAQEHPQWVTGSVFHLGDPTARQWITDLLSDCIAKWGVDIYRQDHNLTAFGMWQAADKADPDRRGMAEIRYVEGLYAMWDELLRRHPGLLIDNANWRETGCDLEMVKRSIGSLTRSEYTLSGTQPSSDQTGTATLSQYVPLSASLVAGFDPYLVRSGATSGVGFIPDPRDKKFPVEQARQAFEEIRSLRPYWSGDFYPLIERIDSDEHNWCAWQFHRPDLDAGFAVFFRRGKSPFVIADVALRGLDANAK